MSADEAALADLVTFAGLEVSSHDLEPWAEVLADLRRHAIVSDEEAYWLVKLYNAYDDLGSAWRVFRRWGSPREWAVSPTAAQAADYPCTNERRNLRGGKVLRHLDSYVAHLADQSQARWINTGLAPAGAPPEADFRALFGHLRQVWGAGRQTAFEWCEFLAKVLDVPVRAPDAELWESEGPRRSLQRLYGNDRPTLDWLNARATATRERLAAAGVPLEWEDFETVICDFNVMRDGRYYPGKHLAALRAEIESVPEPADRAVLAASFARVVPPGWRDIEPGVDNGLAGHYRRTGRMVAAP